MAYKFQPGKMYRMPTHFGPLMGPRQGPDGRKFECKDNPKNTSVSVSFLSNAEQLKALLPDCFELGGEPVVTVYANYMKEIEWLAGRGYNILGVSFPAVFKGARDHVRGPFLSVLWENLCDPIITGREELGFSKIYCEMPEPRITSSEAQAVAGWLGFNFLDISVTNLRPKSEVRHLRRAVARKLMGRFTTNICRERGYGVQRILPIRLLRLRREGIERLKST